MAFELYPYQKEGVKFLASKDAAILGDDMGVGKTVQAIYAAKSLAARRVLVVCPLAVRHTWARVIKEHVPTALVREIKNAKQYAKAQQREWVVVNYDIVWREPLRKQFSEQEWDVVICDEAHALKNVKSKRTQGVLSNKNGVVVKSNRVWLLTGTPVLNRPVELYSILHFLFPCEIADCAGYFDFTKKFCGGRQGTFGWEANGATNVEELARRLKPHMLRRMKSEVAKDLPAVTVTPVVIEPSKIAEKALKRERELSGTVESLADRAERLSVGEIVGIRRQIGIEKIGFAVDYLEEIGEKTVVFTYHRDVANGIQQAFPTDSVLYTGEQTAAEKETALTAFIEGDKRFFIAQIKAGGVGIDGLQKVSCNIVFVELSYVPGEIDQAIGRLHRNGQTKPVSVSVLVHENSVDEDIMKTLDKKRKVITKLVGDKGREDFLKQLQDLGVL